MSGEPIPCSLCSTCGQYFEAILPLCPACAARHNAARDLAIVQAKLTQAERDRDELRSRLTEPIDDDEVEHLCSVQRDSWAREAIRKLARERDRLQALMGAAEAPTAPQASETFLRALQTSLNRFSMENSSNTPDFVLAEFLQGVLHQFNTAVVRRAAWYGKTNSPGRDEPSSGPRPLAESTSRD